MQGFIIKTVTVRDEDLIVTIITNEGLRSLYRFYGVRHSIINVGFKIDFQEERSVKVDIARLKDVLLLNYPWLLQRDRFMLWQQFITLFYEHLKTDEIRTNIYFELLEEAAYIWHIQNPKRVAIETYINLLSKEGRLHLNKRCFICENSIDKDNFTLCRGFLNAHTFCANSKVLAYEGVEYLFSNKSSLFIEDEDVEFLYKIMCEGF